MKFDTTIKDQIIPIWKPIGLSTHTISKLVSSKLGVPVAHTGTLDPMAEGVVILLSGEKRYNKIDFAGWSKEYEFEILFGLSTDTFDPMGLLTATDFAFKFDRELFYKTISAFQPSYTQTYPPFSAKKVKGKPMHYYAQRGELDSISYPTLEAHIYSFEILGESWITIQDFLESTCSKITKVEGYFRQEAILKSWEDFRHKIDVHINLNLVKIKVIVSRGVYVRALAVDVASKLGTCALTYSIVRTQNGKYTKRDCFDY